MKTSTNTLSHVRKSGLKNFLTNAKVFLILFLLLGMATSGNADCPGHNSPSCNFFGPLVACVGASTLDTITVSYGSTSPEFTFKFLINGSNGSTNGIVTPYGGFSDSTFQGTVVVNSGTTAGPLDIQLTVYVTFSDGCTDSTICTKSITVINVEATPTFAPIVCVGGTTTLQVTGSGGSTYQYTLLPSGPTNTTGTFTGLPAGNYSVRVTGESFVQKLDTCAMTVTNIIIPPGSSALVYAKCPNAVTEPACTSSSQIASDFAAWKAAFHDSSDAGATNVRNVLHLTAQSAPDACSGGSVTGVDSAFSTCDSVVCSSSFTVTAAPSTTFNCASNINESACVSQGTLDADWATWLAGFTATGGCNLTKGFVGSAPTEPNKCGGTVTAKWTATSSCDANAPAYLHCNFGCSLLLQQQRLTVLPMQLNQLVLARVR